MGAQRVTEALRDGFNRLPPGLRRAALHGAGKYAPWEVGFDFTPPRPAPGETTGPPDFVGIGVQKAGTTWWMDRLASHPGVSTRPDIHKERHFFDRFGARPFGPDDVVAYHGWFPRRPGTLAGEWTPDYLALPWVPPLLRTAAPGVRLLVLLRDPVDRFFSGLAHQARAGHAADGEVMADAFRRGLYHEALARWLECFDRSQMLVMQYERCVLDPGTQLDRTLEFLGLSPRPDPDGPANTSARAPARPVDPDVRARLTDLYAPDVAALSRLLPDLDLSLWPNFSAEGGGDAS